MKISLRRRHAQTVKNGASSHKTNCIDIFSEILNPEGHQNRCIGLKVTLILLNGYILPTGGAVWDEYQFCGRMNIQIYLLLRYWTNEYPNIFGMIKRSQMNIRINLP